MTEPRRATRCMVRSWLLGRLAGHLDNARGRIEQVLALDDHELIAAVGGRGKAHVRARVRGRRTSTRCARAREPPAWTSCAECDPAYPAGLRELAAPPAVLYVAGGLERFVRLTGEDPVAIVGARKASPYGLDVAQLARAGARASPGSRS